MKQQRDEDSAADSEAVRLDKYLWAARFYKTRSLARAAIEGGKVFYNDQRCKPGKTVAVGAEIRFRAGFSQRTVVITAVSGRRGSAPDAALLYEETPESLAARGQEAEVRRQLKTAAMPPARRPTKRDRRQIHRFRNVNDENQQ
ncbi:RNA-binding S4 domain-containing protein [Allohahella sp. A8]|uniref:RNA-binding S4 domain-containing protein n=1 Tax=Allohahella sp. A8 TaxID=3141461 RepID=UPI003A813BD4